jgi:AraC family transcriptional regulator
VELRDGHPTPSRRGRRRRRACTAGDERSRGRRDRRSQKLSTIHPSTLGASASRRAHVRPAARTIGWFSIAPAAPDAMLTEMPLLDPVSVEAQGTVAPAHDAWHVIDVHQSAPSHAVVRLDGQIRREAQLPGMFTIVPAGLVGTWEMSAKVRALLLRLSPTLFAEAELTPAINLRDPRIEHLAALIRAERDEGYPTGQLYLDSLATALAARLIALQAPRTTAMRTARLPGPRLRAVVEHIHAHLDRDLHLDELAAIAGFSPSHFKLLFKQTTGTPVHRYVLARRLERARELLLTGELEITTVALATGFSHGSHLARCMRRWLGLSPRDLARGR